MTNNDTSSHIQPGFTPFTDTTEPSEPQAPTSVHEEPSEKWPYPEQAEQESGLAPPDTRPHRDLRTEQLLHRIFLRSAWDPEEHAREVDQLLDEARWRDHAEPRVLQRAIEAKKEGISAHKLAAEIEGKLRRGTTAAQLRAWAAEEEGTRWIKEHLNFQINKQISWWENKKKHAAALGERSTLRRLTLINGVHPCSLPHRKPATEWTILIDETGKRFEPKPDTANDDNAGQKKKPSHPIGRLVAVALAPDASRILKGIHPFHSTDAAPDKVDAVLQELLDSGAGVFGLTVDDPATHASGWFGHIHELVRWVMLQLPIEPAQKTTIEFLIERRGGINQNTRLDVLAQTLESEFAAIDSHRYGKTRLNLRIVGKNEPLMAYVDAVAYTWGTTSRASCDRLKKSALVGHCLLHPDREAFQRLYRAIGPDRLNLKPETWYQLCAASSAEPENGLMRYYLRQLGEQIARARKDEHDSLWLGYLDAVRDHIRRKQFRLPELESTLTWLDTWKPGHRELPPGDRLALETTRLALDNHRGQIDRKRFEVCLDLMETVFPERPAEVCETLLRLAVSATNSFESGIFRPYIQQWLEHPIAIPGRLNRGKLQSTLGQIEAFAGNPQQAVVHFDEALQTFRELTDPLQAAREIQQTSNYHQIARMDDPNVAHTEWVKELTHHLQRGSHKKKNESGLSRVLASSGQHERFDHHIWLRAMTKAPDALKAARDAYLSMFDQWQRHEDHPWPLIDFYRAWLLHDAGRRKDAAAYWTDAIGSCARPDNGPTLHWMAEVMRSATTAMGISNVPRASNEERDRRRGALPAAAHDALARLAEGPGDRATVLSGIAACLPFNFH